MALIISFSEHGFSQISFIVLTIVQTFFYLKPCIHICLCEIVSQLGDTYEMMSNLVTK